MVFGIGCYVLIFPYLSWMCWKNKGMDKTCIQKYILVWFGPRFWLPISFVSENETFSSGISVFHFWALLEMSSLITAHCVFFWKSDCFKSLIVRYRTNLSFYFLWKINCDNKSFNWIQRHTIWFLLLFVSWTYQC